MFKKATIILVFVALVVVTFSQVVSVEAVSSAQGRKVKPTSPLTSPKGKKPYSSQTSYSGPTRVLTLAK